MSIASARNNRRGPNMLVTDTRNPFDKVQPNAPNAPNAKRPEVGQRQGTRLITVDKVLQYASDIPSSQMRGPVKPHHTRTLSGRHPLDPKLTGRTIPQHIPARSSKVSEKLVLLPETEELDEDAYDESDLDSGDGASAPPTDEELAQSKKKGGILKDKSYAERLPKTQRTEKLSRVTAYCTAQAYKMRATAEFVKKQHGARTKLYDDCLYTAYHLPLVGGIAGYRVRSSPVLKSPGGKSVIDEEIERNERHEYREGYFGEIDEYGIRSSPMSGSPARSHAIEDESNLEQSQEQRGAGDYRDEDQDHEERDMSRRRSSSPPRISPDALQFAEMFVFSYGVVVFWNFTERQEKDILADLTFSSHPVQNPARTSYKSPSKSKRVSSAPPPSSKEESTLTTPVSLVTRPQLAEDYETEEFHFEYNPAIPRPRIFNDMITLRSGDHMIKLAMSHAIAQSTKLSFFEERMAGTMDEASWVPRRLALTGKLGMGREEVVRILGALFVGRVDVNLSSNMLDTPSFFWESEPTLHPLYTSMREYLEIHPRVTVLNERCRVFLDLAEILSDSIADNKMTRITWIIIVLIVLSIFVTCSEVFLRFGILTGRRARDGVGAGGMGMGMPGEGMGLGSGWVDVQWSEVMRRRRVWGLVSSVGRFLV
ncbi:DUF155-domain-containing protein [Aulographum hederae CBS 113979]|uniref:DUF155-domain-containing protein n=1 Tax=Aulographum hederae CBS 113979 TaxID=1176131 RepID=A0A6G1GY10_9PEZI|nr:DUF155-domain-containing protein [Aulographum hederae CBS 113979]